MLSSGHTTVCTSSSQLVDPFFDGRVATRITADPVADRRKTEKSLLTSQLPQCGTQDPERDLLSFEPQRLPDFCEIRTANLATLSANTLKYLVLDCFCRRSSRNHRRHFIASSLLKSAEAGKCRFASSDKTYQDISSQETKRAPSGRLSSVFYKIMLLSSIYKLGNHEQETANVDLPNIAHCRRNCHSMFYYTLDLVRVKLRSALKAL